MKLPIVVYFSSRNNYNMMNKYTLKHFPLNTIWVLNIDDFSDEDEKNKGHALCKKYGIPFIDNPSRGMQWSLKTAVEYARNSVPKCNWVVHFQHDNYPLREHFFDRLFEYTNMEDVNNFGTLGFNHVSPKGEHTKKLIKKVSCGEDGIGMVGIAALAKIPKDGYWYNGAVFNMPWDKWGKPFAVEVVPMMSLAFNMDLFDKFVNITDGYHLQFWSYDICLQFCKNNIYNVCLPDLYTLNDMKSKRKFHIHRNSAKSKNPRYFGDYGPHFDTFIKRWGWDWRDKNTFALVMKKYKGTLLKKFFRYDMTEGPIKTFRL